MIGSTFRLAFDGSQVSRGLGNLTRGLGKGLGSIGQGALLSAGHRLTGILGSIAMAAPDAVKEVSEWAGGLTDMSNATGMSISDLVVLEEKFRLAGVSAKESGMVVSRFAKNLKDAAREGGPAADALRELGFDGQFIRDKTIGEAFDKIAQKIANMGSGLENAEGIMSDLFGAKLGYQQLKLFTDYEAVTRQAENNVRKLGETMGSGSAANLDTWSDALGRFENFKRSLVTVGMDEFFKISGGPGGPDKLFDKMMDPEQMRTKIREIGQMLGNTSVWWRESGGLTGMLGDIGKSIGHSIADGIKESFSGGFGIKDLLFPGKKAGAPQAANDLLPELKKANSTLTQIRDENSVARFA